MRGGRQAGNPVYGLHTRLMRLYRSEWRAGIELPQYQMSLLRLVARYWAQGLSLKSEGLPL